MLVAELQLLHMDISLLWESICWEFAEASPIQKEMEKKLDLDAEIYQI